MIFNLERTIKVLEKSKDLALKKGNFGQENLWSMKRDIFTTEECITAALHYICGEQPIEIAPNPYFISDQKLFRIEISFLVNLYQLTLAQLGLKENNMTIKRFAFIMDYMIAVMKLQIRPLKELNAHFPWLKGKIEDMVKEIKPYCDKADEQLKIEEEKLSTSERKNNRKVTVQ